MTTHDFGSGSGPLVVFPDADEDSLKLLEDALTLTGIGNLRVRVHVGVPASETEWLHRVHDADALLLDWRLPDAVLERAPTLKLVSFLGTGAGDQVNLDLADARNITVCNARGYGDVAVAEHTLALLLATVRQVARLDREVRSGSWPVSTGWQLRGRRLGVVGLGGIGRSVAELGRAVGMRVQGWTRNVAAGETERYGVPLVSLEDLMQTSDAVTLHLALTPDTDGLIDRRLLGLMGPNAVLINTARGALVDETALTDALHAGRIRGAGLDVFTHEPLPDNDALRSTDRAVLTPHVGFSTEEAGRELIVQGLENLVGFFRGAPRRVVAPNRVTSRSGEAS